LFARTDTDLCPNLAVRADAERDLSFKREFLAVPLAHFQEATAYLALGQRLEDLAKWGGVGARHAGQVDDQAVAGFEGFAGVRLPLISS
jgi:hypothetical protein